MPVPALVRLSGLACPCRTSASHAMPYRTSRSKPRRTSPHHAFPAAVHIAASHRAGDSHSCRAHRGPAVPCQSCLSLPVTALPFQACLSKSCPAIAHFASPASPRQASRSTSGPHPASPAPPNPAEHLRAIPSLACQSSPFTTTNSSPFPTSPVLPRLSPPDIACPSHATPALYWELSGRESTRRVLVIERACRLRRRRSQTGPSQERWISRVVLRRCRHPNPPA